MSRKNANGSGRLLRLAEIITQHFVEEIEAGLDGWRNQCIYYHESNAEEIPVDELCIRINDAREITIAYYADAKKAAEEEALEI